MRLCRFDAGAGGYLARETETETETETGARRHGHADGRAAALASTRGTTARSAISAPPAS